MVGHADQLRDDAGRGRCCHRFSIIDNGAHDQAKRFSHSVARPEAQPADDSGEHPNAGENEYKPFLSKTVLESILVMELEILSHEE